MERVAHVPVPDDFGKNTLYVVFFDGPNDGTTVQATLQGRGLRPVKRAGFPWEFTFYPCRVGEDMEVDLFVGRMGDQTPGRLSVRTPGW